MGEARDVSEQWVKAVSNGDKDAFRALLADDVEFKEAGTPQLKGADQVMPIVDVYFTAFPGAGYTIQNWYESGNTAILEGSYSGVHSGPMQMPNGQELPATGKHVDIPIVSINEVEGGKIVNHRSYWDVMDFMTQLGVMEAPSS